MVLYKRIVRVSTYMLVTVCAVCFGVLIRAWTRGEFRSVESFREYMTGYGMLAPIMLAFFQAAQVVIPVLPGFLGCAAGAIMFGSIGGFLCNYIGISFGSIFAFWLGRRYGARLLAVLFQNKKYDQWTKRASKSKSFVALLFMAMLLPLFPDDYLCYLSGVTRMSAKKFVWIIILGKPWCILAYSLGFSLIK